MISYTRRNRAVCRVACSLAAVLLLLSAGFVTEAAPPRATRLRPHPVAPVRAQAAPEAAFSVTNLNDSGPGSFRQAVTDAVASGDASNTITFAVTGTITLTSGPLPSLVFETLTVDGPGADLLTIDAHGAAGLFNLTFSTLALDGLTITGVSGASVITSVFSTITINESVFSNNTGASLGGVINGTFDVWTITDSTFSGNSATTGGVFSATFVTPLTITGSTFSGNSATGSGGVIAHVFTDVTVVNSTFSGNSSVTGGSVFDSVFGTQSMSFVTLFGNTGGAGAVVQLTTPVTVKNSVFADNTPGGCSGAVVAQGVNFSTDATCGFTMVTSVQLALGPLADNGGPTMTHALNQGSVAIDAVTDCTDILLNPITVDQRGMPRPIDGNADNMALCDAGAYEAPCFGDVTPPVITCPMNVTTAGDTVDTTTCAITSGALTYPAPTATDNCLITEAPVCTPPSGSAFPVGTTTVTCTATDSVGNTASCSFLVTVSSPFTPGLCFVDDARGDVFRIITSTTDPNRGFWTYFEVATGNTYCGFAESLAFLANRSLTAYDRDNPLYNMKATASYSTKTATVEVLIRQTQRTLILRDRNITNNTCP